MHRIERLKAKLIPAKFVTLLAGWFARNKTPWLKNTLIKQFIRAFHVNMNEAIVESPEQYSCFNDFFIRKLKPELRPISPIDIVCPVDGIMASHGQIKHGTLIQAKGHDYSAKALLTDEKLADLFQQGIFVTLYLSPKDYHRIHMPVDAIITDMIYVPGKLFSVNPKTAEAVENLFARNERLVVSCETKTGPMVMVLVGATIVGTIGTVWHGDIKRTKAIKHWHYDTPISLDKGDEMGYFKLGSTVILLFTNKPALTLAKNFVNAPDVQFGEAFATIEDGDSD